MEFTRDTRRVRSVALISLIDVMFFILLFFMLSTHFLQSESIELRMPVSEKQAKDSLTLNVYVSGDNTISMANESYDLKRFDEEVRKMLLIAPERKLQVLSDETTSVQQLVTILDVLYRRGGQNISVAKWQRQIMEAPNGL